MVKAKATMKLNDGEVEFIVERDASDVKDALKRIKEGMDEAFDYSFNADRWQTIEITLIRA